jgi:inner membrane transporter RhtA
VGPDVVAPAERVPLRNRTTALLDTTPAWGLAVFAMFSIQLGSAVSVSLFPEIGTGGTAWLRLTLGALILILVVQPRIGSITRKNVPGLLGLGVTTGLMTLAFLAAIDRIPLGTAVAIEFLGPLTVAAISGKNKKAAIWPLVALIGVVLMTEPWTTNVDPVGVGFAALAGLFWGLYIVLTQQVGDQFTGVEGLALSTPIAAFTAAWVGVPQAWGNITWQVLAVGLLLGLLTPAVPFALEMLALKRMNKRAFGTLMAVEPAIASLMGVAILLQIPGVLDIAGIALVILAGVATQRDAARPPLMDIPATPERPSI